jgi:hypothetical protein
LRDFGRALVGGVGTMGSLHEFLDSKLVCDATSLVGMVEGDCVDEDWEALSWGGDFVPLLGDFDDLADVWHLVIERNGKDKSILGNSLAPSVKFGRAGYCISTCLKLGAQVCSHTWMEQSVSCAVVVEPKPSPSSTWEPRRQASLERHASDEPYWCRGGGRSALRKW